MKLTIREEVGSFSPIMWAYHFRAGIAVPFSGHGGRKMPIKHKRSQEAEHGEI